MAAGGAALSGGQRQRIALTRALYGDPVVVVLDEPDAHLDAAGAEALNRTVTELKARGGSAVIVAHRAAAFEACDHVLMMDAGRLRPAGPKDGVRPRPAAGQARAVPVRVVSGPPALRSAVRGVKPAPGPNSADGGDTA